MNNNLSDLNNHLFKQLDRLGDKDVTQEQLENEINRTDAIVKVSKEVINNATLQLDATKLKAEYRGLTAGDLPNLLPTKN
mgnify:CR=1 FL=1